MLRNPEIEILDREDRCPTFNCYSDVLEYNLKSALSGRHLDRMAEEEVDAHILVKYDIQQKLGKGVSDMCLYELPTDVFC